MSAIGDFKTAVAGLTAAIVAEDWAEARKKNVLAQARYLALPAESQHGETVTKWREYKSLLEEIDRIEEAESRASRTSAFVRTRVGF